MLIAINEVIYLISDILVNFLSTNVNALSPEEFFDLLHIKFKCEKEVLEGFIVTFAKILKDLY
jgi:hypothetical protein